MGSIPLGSPFLVRENGDGEANSNLGSTAPREALPPVSAIRVNPFAPSGLANLRRIPRALLPPLSFLATSTSPVMLVGLSSFAVGGQGARREVYDGP
jgi:hypothetical protein